jgi:transcriptional regulator GlxA family with amidase domain
MPIRQVVVHLISAMAISQPRIDMGFRDKPERTRVHLELVPDWESMVVEAKYSARELAIQCGFSIRHLQRFIMRRYRKSLGDFIAGIRLQKAYFLLQSGFSIKETAHGLGYKQVSHFCRCFKNHFAANASCVLLTSTRLGNDHGRSEQQLQLELFQPRQTSQRKTTQRRMVKRRRR